ncbi:MurR/RpiR family transcriptional regulator [Vibrio fluvialis]|nr:MurR/RpiR family transcriptional regulator [Vibrio fluvialis]EKO3460774.1 MurR/RpiR family transcriptional regulator [Vibrio fluvialis]EKO3465948.1 MurR/RpiR family transcriptional regulator [Vibrio fluvialis]EKO3505504.1 MurR/RpiR family transcriptional regulator [Vibrio fluvialis]ELO4021821.1 MurR/RpiR family transcriptional regulator [Vibrio fluvialis]
MTNNHHSLSERITQQYSRLTESSRRVADYLQLNPEKILMLSTAEIAESCSVSKTSVSRFIRQLGYDDHVALRQELMQEREKGIPVLTSNIEDPGIQHDMRALEQLWAQLATLDVTELVEAIANAKRVKIIGYRNSYPLAMHFRQQLMQCRANVELLPLPGQTLGEDLVSITDDDFVIVIGIRRRIAQFEKIIQHLNGKPSLLITDQSGQKYADSVAHFLVCHMNNQAPLDSYAVPMSLISYLVNKVYRHLGQNAAKLSRHISQSYAQLNEVE